MYSRLELFVVLLWVLSLQNNGIRRGLLLFQPVAHVECIIEI
jgi:hypothetical protein